MSGSQIDKLFNQYENAFDKLDMKTISGYCADNFISAGPTGSIAQSRAEYEEKTREIIDFYKSVGRSSARIISKRVMPICTEYSMVVVRWGMTFERTGARLIEFDKSYIVREIDSSPRIILLISHEDEEAAIKKLGMQSNSHLY